MSYIDQILTSAKSAAVGSMIFTSFRDTLYENIHHRELSNHSFVVIMLCCFLFFIQVLSDSALASVKEAFMDAFDENGDDKIEISEVCLLRYQCH